MRSTVSPSLYVCTLSDLCLQKQRGTWAPSAEALRAIFQQRKFTSLEGAAEPQGYATHRTESLLDSSYASKTYTHPPSCSQ